MSSKTCDFDSFPSLILKKCIDLFPIVLHIVHLSPCRGNFCDVLKQAYVTSLFKKNESLDYDDVSNHRPTSNYSFLSTIFEECVHIHTNLYLP